MNRISDNARVARITTIAKGYSLWWREKNVRLDLGIGKLIPEWKAFFSMKDAGADVAAGLTVASVAIPLSLAIALASGVTPQAGLVTAIVAGLVCACFGGTPLSVSGPAAAMAVLIAANMERFGLGGLIVIGLGCGFLQLLFGILGLGRLVRYIPVPVVAGFTAGIGAIIFLGQLPRALGLPPPDQAHVLSVVRHVFSIFGSTQIPVFALSAMTVAIAKLLPKFYPKLPAPLIAVGTATLAANLLPFSVPLLGEIPNSLPMPKFPQIPLSNLPTLLGSAFVVFCLASLETLLSSLAVDKLSKGQKHDPDQELIGQGLGNIAVACFGGIPITGVIARSALNVKSGAKTRRSAIIHALTLLAAVMFLAPLIGRIPIAALAGLLISVALSMMQPREFIHLWKVAPNEAVIYAITFVTIVFTDLIVGVQAGVVAAVIIAILRLGKMEAYYHQSGNIPVLVMSGPMTFLASAEFQKLVSRQERHAKPRQLILEMSHVTWMDSSGAESFVEMVRQFKNEGTQLAIQGLPAGSWKTLQKVDVEKVTTRLLAVTEADTAKLLGTEKKNRGRDRLVQGVERFQREQQGRYKEIFHRLAYEQQPHTLFITCADSRIVPNLMTSTEPGELFIIRNVGNLVPPFGDDETPGEGAAVEFAVNVLDVREIVICGHTGCGAMYAISSGHDLSALPSLEKWLKPIAHLAPGFPEPSDPNDMAKANVLLQMHHLRSYPEIAKKMAKGDLKLRGWMYEVGTGGILEWDQDSGSFKAPGNPLVKSVVGGE